ncbi:MAG: DNRLRE domain-containing protein [Vicinamibacterales bacterium]
MSSLRHSLPLRLIVPVGLAVLVAAGSASAGPILFAADADTYLRDETPRGDQAFMDVRAFTGGIGNFRGYLRFDLSGLTDPITDASLTLTISGGASRNDAITTTRFSLYGLASAAGNTPQDWDEATFVPSLMGTEDVTTLMGVYDLDGDVPGMSEVVSAQSADPGTTITISGAPLVAFLQSRLADDGLATFILSNDDSVARGYGLATKENPTAAWRPLLSLGVDPSGGPGPDPGPVPVPEPGTIGLLGLGLAAAAGRRRASRRR